MFKKYSILIWLSVLLILVGIYLAVEYTGSKDRTFRSMVVTFDPEKITTVSITDMKSGSRVELRKEGDGLKVYEDGKEYNGEPRALTHTLDLLNTLSTESIVATKEEKWAEYKVDEDQAIIVELFEGDALIEKLFVGKFGFKQIPSQNPQQQAQTKMTSYIRTDGDDMVYAVDGLLRTTFSEGKTPFRDRYLFSCEEPTDISKLTFTGLNETLVLDMSTSAWQLNGMPVDSVKTARYLQNLARLNNSGFIDDVDLSGMAPAYTLIVEGRNFVPVTLSAFQADTNTGYFITSSMNEGTVFDGSKSNLFEKTFVGKEKFLPE